MKKTLIIMNTRWPIGRYLFDCVRNENIDICQTYKTKSHNFKYLLMVMHIEKMKLPFQSIWYGTWKRKINEYDKIIVFNNLLSLNIINYIRKKNKNARLILFWWDSISKESYALPSTKIRSKCELWTYDKNDAERYGLNASYQFFYPSKIDNAVQKYDLLIIMKDKGRYKRIIQMYDRLTNLGLKVFLRIIPDKTSTNVDKFYGKELEYKDVLKLVGQSKCILDIPKEGQQGLTLRVMESIFYEKKLITTNTNVMNESFYNSNNIMIWNNQSDEEIISFFSDEYESIDEAIINRFRFEHWVEDFG